MANYKTPGVYVEEISKLPASVAPVATAIPAFIGYTEKSEKDGETLSANTPIRITSLLEYEEIFGSAFEEELSVTLTGSDTTEANTSIAVAATSKLSPYTMYYNLVMYFGNGGGPCYVVSVGNYASAPIPSSASAWKALISVTDLQAGIAAIEKEDEVTLLVVPEAIIMDPANRKTVNDDMLTQCNKLQDRFAIMDAAVLGGTVNDDGIGFRADVGSDYLKYGASYYPSLLTTLDLNFDNADIDIIDSRTGGTFNGLTLESIVDGVTLAVASQATITVDDYTALAGDGVNINGIDFVEGSGDPTTGWAAGVTSNINAATSLAMALTNQGDSAYTFSRSANVITLTATTAGSAGDSTPFSYTDNGTPGITLSGFSGGSDGLDPDKTLYNNIISEISKLFKIRLYPSSAIAGVYARVDNNRGVWKAPANVSLRLVKEPTVLVTNEQQQNLNVDATSGKSINVIRNFTGKGIIVWGSRTLAGNDNEWRYVPVRRLFNFVEESVKKATEFVVFEPNDARTWLRTKTMIENFLSGLWRQGALAGATTEDAFYVKVGLGETMTSLDILEGRMNIEIGMAAVRPAEFIILKFSHKLQES